MTGIRIFNSTVFANGLSDELKAYPQDRLAAPLDERTAQLSFTSGAVPGNAQTLMSRDGRTAQTPARDRLAELIAVPNLTPGLVLLGLLFAVVLGATHALSPGHGKTVVGAYLVGSRGTARHAAFLGLTVTITHTAGVFALGLVTLLASEYVVPEKLFPILSLISGAIVVAIGLSLFVRRLRAALRLNAHHHHGHDHGHEHNHHHDGDPTQPHAHGGRVHSHLPPGADGAPITWKSLLALGVSGGILPCPSALVVLLAAISLHRVGYGLLLVLAFSVGLASVLTGVGLAFVYAGRLLKSTGALNRLSRVLPIVSAFVITCAGLAISYQALGQAGIDLIATAGTLFARITSAANAPSFTSLGALGLLGLGLVYGLKHATEVDHIVAVSAIVSEHKKLGRAAIVGGLWGAGHTASLVLVGAIVLGLRVAIPERVAGWLEFGVALMIITLGVLAFLRALRGRSDVHLHQHGHGENAHRHVHFHDSSNGHVHSWSGTHSHAIAKIGLKPGLVGAMHGLAGSGALTLLVLTQINSPLLGLIYRAVFGIGSIFGMLLMSALIGLPFVFSSRKFGGIHYGLQALAGILSIAFGIWYAYETGVSSLLKSLGTV
jgi:ABC-type nickel/cobalt efflux system permease component RcnA